MEPDRYHPLQHREGRPSLEQSNTECQQEHQMHRQPLLHDRDHRSVSPFLGENDHSLHNSPLPNGFVPEDTGPSVDMWNPMWLHHSVLLGFATVFALMALAVVLLYYLSQAMNGLAVSTESRHYLWTFGPTACLTITTSLWGRVNFATRHLAPWTELRNGPTQAEKSILLDYISPTYPEIMFDAFRKRHWIILSSSLAIVLLRLAVCWFPYMRKENRGADEVQTAFSTGLMALESTLIIKENAEFRLSSRFDASSFDARNISGATLVGPISYATLAKGLQYPLGTGQDFVVQDFDPQGLISTPGVYSTEVTGFNPDLDCDILNVSNSSIVPRSFPWRSILAEFFVVNITTPDCKINEALIGETAGHNFMYRTDATQNYQGNIQNYTCNDPTNQLVPDLYRSNSTTSHGNAGQRVLITMADLRWPHLSPDMEVPNSYRVEGITALLCRPSYLLNTYVSRRSIDPTTSAASMEVSMSRKNSSRLTNLSMDQFAGGVLNTFLHMRMGKGGEDCVLTDPVPNFFQVLSAANNDSGLASFMDAKLLKKVSVDVWRTTAAQYARQYLMIPTNDSVHGSISYRQNRLQVKLLSTVLMTILSGMLSLIALFIWWFGPKPAVPRDPVPLAAMATLLATSPGLSKLMTGLGAARMSSIRNATAGRHFQTTISNQHFALGVEAYEELEQRPAQTPVKEKPLEWWRPVVTRSWFLLLTAAVSLVLAILLIILQRISDTQQGIRDISPDLRVVPRYLSALITISVAALYSSVEGASAIFAPFSHLKTGDFFAESTIESNVVGKLLPHGILISARNRHFHHVLSGIALFAAGFLTTIASGLYTVTTAPVVESVTLRQADGFNFSQGEFSIDDRNAAATTSILEYTNLSYPAWTYGDLAFNKLDTTAGIRGDGTINLELPAYRARLDCTSHFLEEKDLKVRSWFPEDDFSDFQFNVTVPVRCAHIPTNQSTVNWGERYSFPFNTSSFYSGSATLFQWSVESEIDLISEGEVENQGHGFSFWWWKIATGNFGCPTFGFTIASSAVAPGRSSKNTTVHTNATAVMCAQHLEQVTANVTLRAADLSIDPAHPPLADETTTKRLRSPDTNSEVWEWPLLNFKNRMVDLSPTPQLQTSDSMDRELINAGYFPILPGIDGFVKTLVDGKAGVPIASLLGEANQGAFVKAGSRLYAEYMAQAISSNMRDARSTTNTVGGNDNNTDDGGTIATFQATLTNALGRWRLHQNRGPAAALEALMFLLAAIALLLVFIWDRAEVLPHNPCSIAGTASLLAGSEVCARRYVPEGAEWWSGDRRRAAGMWDGVKLRMGWWYGGPAENDQAKFGVHVEGE